MTAARVWDGIGPKTECLLRVKWADSSAFEWVHFNWRDADASGYNDGEGEYSCNSDEYFNEGSSITISQTCDYRGWSDEFDNINGADFEITHWAELPEIEEEQSRLRSRIENDVEEGAFGG